MASLTPGDTGSACWPALPVFVRVAGRAVVLVGEGEAADAKRRLLERAGAAVVGEEAADARLAIVVADEDAAARLKARGLLVNVVDRPDLCDFTLPAIVDRSPVLVAVGTGGVSAGLAAALRQRLEMILPATLGSLAQALHAARAELRRRFPDGGDRRRALGAALSAGGTLDPLDPASGAVLAAIDTPPAARTEHIRLRSRDPDDLMLRQARWLAQADRLTHRRDVPAAILDRARADAVRLATDAPLTDDMPGLTVDVALEVQGT